MVYLTIILRTVLLPLSSTGIGALPPPDLAPVLFSELIERDWASDSRDIVSILQFKPLNFISYDSSFISIFRGASTILLGGREIP